MKQYSVYWSKEAKTDLEEIVDYISKDSVSATKSVYKKIRLKCKQLNISPERYRRVPELLEFGIKNYREIISPPYRVIYKISDYNIYIIAVVDGRRDVESFIFDRLLRER
jgi:addiction module RelE/StbE family toxin